MILDTNALSALAEGDKEVVPQIRQAGPVAVSVIVLGEYYFGIAASRYKAAYERWLENAKADLEVLNITESTSRHYAVLRAELNARGRPIPSNDLWIAALCREHSRSILSRDRHFDHIHGVRRVSW